MTSGGTSGPGTDERRTDTRQQIRAVALELFAEQGYEKTSLREIAERLGVTKAAVYYHYRTKEEILTSLLDEHLGEIDALVEWAEAQPPGRERRRAVIERYSAQLAVMAEDGSQLIRFMQENQTSMKELAAAAGMRKRFERLAATLVDPDGSAADQLRSRLSLMALNFGAFARDVLPGAPAGRRAAALEVALELGGS